MCEPEAPAYFSTIDAVVIYVFTVDYVLRLALCGTVPRRLANVIPETWDEDERALASAEGRFPDMDPPPLSTWYQMLCYAVKTQNLVDLIAIIPFYIELGSPSGGPLLSVFRVMRLTRLLSMVKISKSSGPRVSPPTLPPPRWQQEPQRSPHSRLLNLISPPFPRSSLAPLVPCLLADYTYVMTQAFRKSLAVLAPLSFFVSLIIVLFGCLMFVVEQGTFTVTKVRLSPNTTLPSLTPLSPLSLPTLAPSCEGLPDGRLPAGKHRRQRAGALALLDHLHHHVLRRGDDHHGRVRRRVPDQPRRPRFGVRVCLRGYHHLDVPHRRRG